MKPYEGFEDSDITTKKMEHYLFHVDECKSTLKFLKAKYCLEKNGDFLIICPEVNILSDNVKFTSNHEETFIQAYSNIHVAVPFSTMKTNCTSCDDGYVKITGYPYKISLFYHCFKDNDFAPSAYTFDYEDYLLNNNFSKDIVNKCHSYILQFLKDHPEIKDLQLNNTIKTMLPFA